MHPNNIWKKKNNKITTIWEKWKSLQLRYRLADWFLKGNPITYCLKEKQLTATVRDKLKENWWKTIYQTKENSRIKWRERKPKHSCNGKWDGSRNK